MYAVLYVEIASPHTPQLISWCDAVLAFTIVESMTIMMTATTMICLLYTPGNGQTHMSKSMYIIIMYGMVIELEHGHRCLLAIPHLLMCNFGITFRIRL